MAAQRPQTLESSRLLPELIAARGIAAVWVVLAHTLSIALRGQAELPAAVEYTRLVVDFFFIQSGFVLAHIYDPDWRAGRFRYFTFLGRRLSRLWPLHVATLVAAACLVIAGHLVGLHPDNPHTPWTFIVTLAMLHSTWATTDLAWNWPSWSVSAEWCAYIAIPLYLLAADRVRGTLPRIAVGLGLFVAIAAFSEIVLRQDLVTRTFDGGTLRIVPSFFAGVLLRRIFDDEPAMLRMTPPVYAGLLIAVFGACVAMIAAGATYDMLWPPMVVLVATLASRGVWEEPGVLRGRALAWLGEMSYAIYLTHALVLYALFAGGKLLGVADTLPRRALLGGAAIMATLAVSQIAYSTVEKPGRAIMAKLFFARRTRLTTVASSESGLGT